MSPNDTDDGINKDLGDEKLSNLYREAAREEPPMKLDSAILSEARKAVEKRKSLWCRVRWLVPLTSFAVAILTASLVIQMKREHPEIITPAEESISQPALQNAPALESKGLMKDELRQAEPARTEKRKAAAPLMEMEAAQDAMKPAPALNLGGAAEKREAVGKSQFRARNAEANGGKPATLQAAPPEAASNPTPEVWIERIRALLKQGKKEEALRELETFGTIYPDYELPDDLASLKHSPASPER